MVEYYFLTMVLVVGGGGGSGVAVEDVATLPVTHNPNLHRLLPPQAKRCSLRTNVSRLSSQPKWKSDYGLIFHSVTHFAMIYWRLYCTKMCTLSVSLLVPCLRQHTAEGLWELGLSLSLVCHRLFTTAGMQVQAMLTRLNNKNICP